MTRLPVSPGISGIPTGTIPTDPSAFVEWFKNSYLPRWAANADVRNATPGVGVQISGDLSSPGFVGFEEISGVSVLGNPTGAQGDVQAITAAADGESLQRIGGSLVFAPVSVLSADSIQGIGSTASPLQLVNDALAPGNSLYYGTNASGVKGFFAIGSTPTPAPALIADLVLWWTSSDILSSANTIISRFKEQTPGITGTLNIGISGVTSGVIVDPVQLNGLNLGLWPVSPNSSNIQLINPIALPVGVTFFAVIKPAAATTAQCIIGGTSTSIAFYLANSAGVAKIGLTSTSTAAIGVATTAWTPGTAFQCNATYLASTGAFAFRQARAGNGSGTGTTGAGGVRGGSTATVFIGADIGLTTNRLFGASLGDLLIYNRVLTAAEIVTVENYLFNKWGV